MLAQNRAFRLSLGAVVLDRPDPRGLYIAKDLVGGWAYQVADGEGDSRFRGHGACDGGLDMALCCAFLAAIGRVPECRQIRVSVDSAAAHRAMAELARGDARVIAGIAGRPMTIMTRPDERATFLTRAAAERAAEAALLERERAERAAAAGFAPPPVPDPAPSASPLSGSGPKQPVAAPAPENRAPEDRAPEDRAVKDRAPEDRAVKDRVPRSRWSDNPVPDRETIAELAGVFAAAVAREMAVAPDWRARHGAANGGPNGGPGVGDAPGMAAAPSPAPADRAPPPTPLRADAPLGTSVGTPPGSRRALTDWLAAFDGHVKSVNADLRDLAR